MTGVFDSQIRSGVPWYDNRGEVVNAHGACIIEEEGRFYLFGEYKQDRGNSFAGFSCYSSADLANWTWEGLALPPEPTGLHSSDRVGERPKVMKCPSTGVYVLYAHTDDLRYEDPVIAVAVSSTINGPYTPMGALEIGGEALRRWDVGTFQDEDGAGYLLLHEGDIYRLASDYLSAESLVSDHVAPGGESPAMFKHHGSYVLLLSHKTMWERNDNFYLTAPSVSGPWTHRGLLAAEGTLTHNSQCTFVLRVDRGDTTSFVYMGDRWSFPMQRSAATYVWQPLELLEDGGAALGPFVPSWNLNGGIEPSQEVARIWFESNIAGSAVEVSVSGCQFGVVAAADAYGGYARVSILDARTREPQHAATVDLYSLVDDTGLRYWSPGLDVGDYIVRVEVTGLYPECFNKAGARFGSLDARVRITGVASRRSIDDAEASYGGHSRGNAR